MRTRLPRLVLLVAVFLATQAPAYLHAALHPAGGVDAGCEVCLHGSGSTSMVPPAEAGSATTWAPDGFRCPAAQAPRSGPSAYRPPARAPPSFA